MKSRIVLEKVAFVAACSASLAIVLCGLIYFDSTSEAESSDSLLSLRGGHGSCHWSNPVNCPTGDGCSGSTCGWGANPLARCPIAGDNAINNPVLAFGAAFRRYYMTCASGATSGLDGCGTVTSVNCGSLETCATGCSPGTPLGAGGQQQPARCKTSSSTPSTKPSQSTGGNVCGAGVA